MKVSDLAGHVSAVTLTVDLLNLNDNEPTCSFGDKTTVTSIEEETDGEYFSLLLILFSNNKKTWIISQAIPTL